MTALLALAWPPEPAHSACLPSDDNVECIGVYKEWSNRVTKRDAEAAGIRWVPREDEPKSYTEAVKLLRAQREIVASFEQRLASDVDGSRTLVDIGSKNLKLRPRVTLAAKYLQRHTSTLSAPLFDAAVDRTLFALDTLDVAIGYAIRSDDPSSAFARKLAIIENLRSAEVEYDTLLSFANDPAAFESA